MAIHWGKDTYLKKAERYIKSALLLDLQQGRTLVEMMVVLALMALLSVIGMSGFKYIVNKRKAEQIIKQAYVAFIDPTARKNTNLFNTWEKVSFNPSSGLNIYTSKDYKAEIYVMIEKVPQELCQHMLTRADKGGLIFYTKDFEKITECDVENDMVIVWNNQGEASQCNETSDCDVGDYESGFPGFCNTHKCQKCKPWEHANADRTGCECTFGQSLTCTDTEQRTWCCGLDEDNNPLICGRNYGECVNPQGQCWMKVRKGSASSQTCVYNIGDYTYCSVEVTKSGSNITIEEDGTCDDSSYCFVQYTNAERTTAIGTDFTSGTLYGVCLSRLDFARISPSTMTEDQGECPLGEYCRLVYTDEELTQSVTTAFSTGKLYGKCVPVLDYTLINPNSFDAGNMDEEQGCPAGYYCNLKWTDKSCTALTTAFSTGILYGECLKLNNYTVSKKCPY